MQPNFLLHGAPIFLGPLAEHFPIWLENQHYSQVFVLADDNTARDCLPYFLEKSGLGGKITLARIRPGEQEKTLATCQGIWAEMMAANLDRNALVLNLGGGVLGDMGGFCAATWKRGIDFVQVPTTLLSMTDAAIGGKTGIDFQGVKNIIGVFQQPAAVFADPFFLQTLPTRELHSGFAEVIKHALIGDAELTKQLMEEATLRLPHPIQAQAWPQILQKSIAVKVRIVQEDPTEKGLRMLLNFGHSIGHAIESHFLASPSPLTHGEAVYFGMRCEAYIAQNVGLGEKIETLGRDIYPVPNIHQKDVVAIWALMQQDKKNSSGTVRMAVPDEWPFSIKILQPTSEAVEQALLLL